MDRIVESQEMTFPDHLPNDVRIKIRNSFASLPEASDDDETVGMNIAVPRGMLSAPISRRWAKAFRAVLGEEICGIVSISEHETFQKFVAKLRKEEFKEFREAAAQGDLQVDDFYAEEESDDDGEEWKQQ